MNTNTNKIANTDENTSINTNTNANTSTNTNGAGGEPKLRQTRKAHYAHSSLNDKQDSNR